MSENLVSCWARKVEKSVKLYKVDRRKRKSAAPCHPTFLPWVVSVLSNFLSQGSERMKSFRLPKTKTERGVRLGSIRVLRTSTGLCVRGEESFPDEGHKAEGGREVLLSRGGSGWEGHRRALFCLQGTKRWMVVPGPALLFTPVSHGN